MPKRLRVDATGRVEVDGELYRLVEREAESMLDVVRERDERVMGSFELSVSESESAAKVKEGSGEDAKLVMQIARLLSTPRGIVPIQ